MEDGSNRWCGDLSKESPTFKPLLPFLQFHIKRIQELWRDPSFPPSFPPCLRTKEKRTRARAKLYMLWQMASSGETYLPCAK